jgi:hypothetical protein
MIMLEEMLYGIEKADEDKIYSKLNTIMIDIYKQALKNDASA